MNRLLMKTNSTHGNWIPDSYREKIWPSSSDFQFPISIFLLSLALLILQARCSPDTKHSASTPVYTCPMHTDVQQPNPGKCPVCGMDLVLKGQASPGSALMLSESQVRLANISTQLVARLPIGQTAVLTARLVVDEQRSKVVSSRTSGRIERLYIKETGRQLQPGEPFMEIYSEALLTLQKEFLLAVEQNRQLPTPRYEAFVKSARKKLFLYGLTKEQLDELARTKVLRERITYTAPAGGFVSAILITEGQYVEEGTPLYRVDDIGRLWVEAELYPGESSHAHLGDTVRVKIPGQQPDAMNGIITFVSPEYRGTSQVTLLRVIVDNPGQNLKPGMQAQVILAYNQREALAVPVDAVIREEHGSHLFVKTATNTFDRRMVQTGLENDELMEIVSGLKAGEEVVITGAYLLHSELVLRGVAPTEHHH
jgi:Cu(I)/Ag(I) efflux system membrane fusion protein